ncbi:MAG: tetratricopeptide repeat protein [Bacteroidia bacterium]
MFTKTLVTLLTLVALACSPLCAQKNVELIDTKKILEEGGEYQANGRQGKAINLYKQVSRNDSAYETVLYHLSICYLDDDQDSLGMLTAQKGIDLNGDYNGIFYTIKGIAYKKMERYPDALAILSEGIAKYPRLPSLNRVKGDVYFTQKNYKDAVPCYQRTIELNMYDEEAHFMLGKCLLEQGRTVPALLTFEFFLLLENGTDRTTKVVTLCENLYTDEYEFDPDQKMTSREAGDQVFDDIAELLSSGVGKSAGYKDKTGLNFNLTRQRQLMIEKLHYEEGSGNWFMENYVPFFTAVQQQGMVVPYSLYSLGTLSGKKVIKAIKKKKRAIKTFAEWAGAKIVDLRKNPKTPLYGDKKGLQHLFNENNVLAALGKENAQGKPVGEWTYFERLSGNKMGVANYNNEGEMDGTFELFYPDGTPREKTIFANGKKNGLSKFWYDNGNLSAEVEFKDDKENGKYVTYLYSGEKEYEGGFKDGKSNGPLTAYYPNGTKSTEANYTEGKLNGELKSWFPTGTKSREANYKDEKKDGPFINYYENGKIQAEGAYTEDEMSGPWKNYFKDGKLKEEGTYNTKGKIIGVWKEYYHNGKIEVESNYDQEGLRQGETNFYEDDGLKLTQLDFVKDLPTRVRSFNEKGEVTHEETASGKRMRVNLYWFNGNKRSTGDYFEGKKDGEWSYYDVNGALEITEMLEAGEGNGKRKQYYSNGQLQNECKLKKGEYDGYFKSYYVNGKIESEGWYVKDQRQGAWYAYTEAGQVAAYRFFRDGELEGHTEFYDAYENIMEDRFYKEETLIQVTELDSSGKVIYDFKTKDGSGPFVWNHTSGKIYQSITYKGGNFEGQRTSGYFNGAKAFTGSYLNGIINGPYSNYYDNGKLQSEGTYILDDLDGLRKDYWENGKLKHEANYVLGEDHGTFKYYFENGQLEREGQYVWGVAEGEFRYYARDGALVGVRWYKHDALVAYSYPDKDGKLVEKKTLKNDGDTLFGYYPNGQMAVKAFYKYGKLEGKRYEYFADGKLAEEENYIAGDRDGEQKYYYANGNLKGEMHMLIDAEHGVQKFYFENGKLKREYNMICDEVYGDVKEYNYDKGATPIITTSRFYNDICIAQTTGK